MGLFKKLKPKLTTIKVDNLKPALLLYYCKTSNLDKEICRRTGVQWNQELADEMERTNAFYFVVKTTLEYDVVPGNAFEKWLKDNFITVRDKSDKATQCINHYIQKLK